MISSLYSFTLLLVTLNSQPPKVNLAPSGFVEKGSLTASSTFALNRSTEISAGWSFASFFAASILSWVYPSGLCTVTPINAPSMPAPSPALAIMKLSLVAMLAITASIAVLIADQGLPFTASAVKLHPLLPSV